MEELDEYLLGTKLTLKYNKIRRNEAEKQKPSKAIVGTLFISDSIFGEKTYY